MSWCDWRTLASLIQGIDQGVGTDAAVSDRDHEETKRAANTSGPREKVVGHDHRRKICRQYHPSVLRGHFGEALIQLRRRTIAACLAFQ